MLVYMPMNMLSGSNTPLESMPPWLATVMEASPSTHFVSFAQSILYRGAGFEVVWPQFLLVAGIGGLFFLRGDPALPFHRGAGDVTHIRHTRDGPIADHSVALVNCLAGTRKKAKNVSRPTRDFTGPAGVKSKKLARFP